MRRTVLGHAIRRQASSENAHVLSCTLRFSKIAFLAWRTLRSFGATEVGLRCSARGKRNMRACDQVRGVYAVVLSAFEYLGAVCEFDSMGKGCSERAMAKSLGFC